MKSDVVSRNYEVISRTRIYEKESRNITRLTKKGNTNRVPLIVLFCLFVCLFGFFCFCLFVCVCFFIVCLLLLLLFLENPKNDTMIH